MADTTPTAEIDQSVLPIVTLMDVCKDALKDYDDSRVVQSRRKDAFRVFMNNYDNIIPGSIFDDHQPYILVVYKEKRDAALSTLDDDSWMEEGVTVWFGSKEDKKQNIKLMISSVFNKAIERKEEIIKTFPEEKYLEMDAYYRADELIYYTLKMFRQAVIGTQYECDGVALDEIILNIGVDIGIKDPNEQRKPQTQGGFMDSIFNGIGTFADNAGIKLPDGRSASEALKSFDMSQLGGVITTVLGNPDMMKNLGTQLGSNTGAPGQAAPEGSTPGMPDMSAVIGTLTKGMAQAISSMPPAGVAVDERTDEQKQEAAAALEAQFTGMASQMTSAMAGIIPQAQGVGVKEK
jgi:hypothetical protein